MQSSNNYPLHANGLYSMDMNLISARMSNEVRNAKIHALKPVATNLLFATALAIAGVVAIAFQQYWIAFLLITATTPFCAKAFVAFKERENVAFRHFFYS